MQKKRRPTRTPARLEPRPLNSSMDVPLEGVTSTAAPQYAGLTSAVEVASRAAAADAADAADAARSSMRGLTLRVALQDAREALLGIPADLYAGDGDLAAVLTRNDRLRGLGVLALALGALLALA